MSHEGRPACACAGMRAACSGGAPQAPPLSLTASARAICCSASASLALVSDFRMATCTAHKGIGQCQERQQCPVEWEAAAGQFCTPRDIINCPACPARTPGPCYHHGETEAHCAGLPVRGRRLSQTAPPTASPWPWPQGRLAGCLRAGGRARGEGVRHIVGSPALERARATQACMQAHAASCAPAPPCWARTQAASISAQHILCHHRRLGDLQVPINQHRHLHPEHGSGGGQATERRPAVGARQRGAGRTFAFADSSATTLLYSATKSGALSCKSTTLYSNGAPETHVSGSAPGDNGL